MIPTRLSKSQLRPFALIRDEFLEETQLPEQGKWRSMSNDAIWLSVVKQVVVVGSVEPSKRLEEPAIQRRLAFKRLAGLRPRQATEALGSALADIGTRYVSRQQPTTSPKVSALYKNLRFLQTCEGGPSGFVALLSRMETSRERISYISKHLSYIKGKGARDFLTTGLGMATDVIALDSRVMGIVRLIVPELPDHVTERNYDAIENFLTRHVCDPLEISAVQFDQLLFRNEACIRGLLRDAAAMPDGRSGQHLPTSRKSRCRDGRPSPVRRGARRPRLR